MEKTKPTSQEKQELVDHIKHGFRPEDVLIRITPQHKKSITQEVQLYNVPANEPGHRFVIVQETYRWGYGYKEGDDMNWPNQFKTNQHYCAVTIGQVSVVLDMKVNWLIYVVDL